MKYRVTVTRRGYLFVETGSKSEAIDIADHQTTDTVNWSEDWHVIEVEEDNPELGGCYITEKAF